MTRHFDCESYKHGSITYEIGSEGVLYKNGKGTKLFGLWKRISHIRNLSGCQVELCVDNQPPIPVPYDTPQFSRLMNALCAGMATTITREFKPQAFLAAPVFLASCLFAVVLGALLLIFGILVTGSAGYVATALMLPLLFLLPFQTLGVTLGTQRMKILKPFNCQTIAYHEIREARLDVRRDRFSSSLVVRVELGSGEVLEFKNLKKSGHFVTLLKHKVRAAR